MIARMLSSVDVTELTPPSNAFDVESASERASVDAVIPLSLGYDTGETDHSVGVTSIIGGPTLAAQIERLGKIVVECPRVSIMDSCRGLTSYYLLIRTRRAWLRSLMRCPGGMPRWRLPIATSCSGIR